MLLSFNSLPIRLLTARLVVSNGMDRWHLLELVNFIATELHKGFAPTL